MNEPFSLTYIDKDYNINIENIHKYKRPKNMLLL